MNSIFLSSIFLLINFPLRERKKEREKERERNFFSSTEHTSVVKCVNQSIGLYIREEFSLENKQYVIFHLQLLNLINQTVEDLADRQE